MRSLRPKTHFVPLGDITETPHISDAPEPRPVIYILHPSTGTKQADPTPIQARDLFALGRNMAKRRISRRKLFNAKNSTTQPQIPGGPACRAAVPKNLHRKANHVCNWLQNPSPLCWQTRTKVLGTPQSPARLAGPAARQLTNLKTPRNH